MGYEDNVGFCVGFAGFLFPIDIRIVECSADNKMATEFEELKLFEFYRGAAKFR